MPSSSVGSVLRAARERLGWTREALAYHSGVSWAAIAQIESGRRKDIRLSSLTALAQALGVTLDHLAAVHAGSQRVLLDHRALIYTSDREFLATTAPFLSQGIERSEPLLAVTTPARIELLRDALGSAERAVEFAEAAEWYSSPLAALTRYRRYIERQVAAGAARIRIIGEPVWAGRAEDQIAEWARYESIINLILAPSPASIICPYDAQATRSDVLAHARHTHPCLVEAGAPVVSSLYQDPESFVVGP